MKTKYLIRIKCQNKSKLLLKLNKLNINLDHIIYENDSLKFIVNENDFCRLKKYLISYKISVVAEIGLKKIKKELKTKRLFLLSLCLGFILFFILSNIIIKVNIIHEDQNIRTILKEALSEYGVTNLSFKKSYAEYEEIIMAIKEAYPEQIEWLEIDVRGLTIDVRVEERIITKETENYNNCHIVANKSGIITSILLQKGVSEVSINDYVNKGDILINGTIKLNDEIKNNVCAQGEIYAEVWYNVNITLPLEYEETTRTGKMRYNFMIKNGTKETVIFKSRVENKEVENQYLFNLFGFEFYWQKEYEITTKKLKYTEEEAIQKAQELIIEKLKLKQSTFSKIITEKVLQKELKNNNIYIDMFIAIEEQIGQVKYYTESE